MSEKANRIHVLLIDDDPEIHLLVRSYLDERGDVFSLHAVPTLAEGFEAIKTSSPHVVLLDLFLTASQGLETFERFHAKVKDIPVVILSSLDDEAVTLQAVQGGAQDYLVKAHVSGRMLTHVLRYAVERYRVHSKKGNQDFVDPVTGLYNLQGFLVLSEQQLRASKRNPAGNLVYLLAVDQIKTIANTLGPNEMNHALKTTAEILKESFRASDIMARVGEDRFAVLPSSASLFQTRTMMARIQNSQTYYNARFNLYKITLRFYSLHLPPEGPFTSDVLLAKMNHAFANYSPNSGNAETLHPS